MRRRLRLIAIAAVAVAFLSNCTDTGDDATPIRETSTTQASVLGAGDVVAALSEHGIPITGVAKQTPQDSGPAQLKESVSFQDERAASPATVDTCVSSPWPEACPVDGVPSAPVERPRATIEVFASTAGAAARIDALSRSAVPSFTGPVIRSGPIVVRFPAGFYDSLVDEYQAVLLAMWPGSTKPG